jgi:hypothetical protein
MQNVRHLTGTVAGGAIRGWSGGVTREAIAPMAFIALILLSNYALSGLPNVKLFDLLVFVAGYTLGLRRGILVAAGAWFVYGQLNPWGATHAALLLTLIAGESLFAVVGALARMAMPLSRMRLGPSVASVMFVVAALATTAAYDLLANLYTGYYWSVLAGGDELGRWLGIAVFGPGAVFFMAVHAGANVALFPVFGPLLIKGAERAKQRFGLS